LGGAKREDLQQQQRKGKGSTHPNTWKKEFSHFPMEKKGGRVFRCKDRKPFLHREKANLLIEEKEEAVLRFGGRKKERRRAE